MKLAIIGTHSTGKTTLVNKLAEKLRTNGYKVTVVPEMARLCPYPINGGTSHEAQQWILEKQIAEENLLNDEDGIIVCDRACIDSLAYYHRHGLLSNSLEKVLPWEEVAARHVPTYDFLFKTQKLPIPAVADGQRDVDEDFRQEIDEILLGLLKKYDVPFTLLPATADYDTHIDFIIDRIKERQN